MLKKIKEFGGAKLLSKKQQSEIKGGLYTYNIKGYTVHCINEVHPSEFGKICRNTMCLVPVELCGNSPF